MTRTSRLIPALAIALLTSSALAQTYPSPSVATPTTAAQAANKAYVDAAVAAITSSLGNAANLTAGILPAARLPIGTAAGTVAAGNDPRIPSGNAGAANGAAVLGATGVLPSSVIPAGTGGTAYTLLPASASVLGGVKQGTGTAIASDGTISVTVGGTTYTLPAASASALGGVKVGAGLAVASDGTLSSTGSGTVTVGTTAGTVAAGNDSRIVGAATATALTAETTRATAAEATLTTSDAAKQTAAQVQAAITTALAALPTSHTMTAASYTAAGAVTIPASSNVSATVCIATATTPPPVLTLAAGSFDGQVINLKRVCTAAFGLVAAMDNQPSNSSNPLNTGSGLTLPLDDIDLHWNAALTSWLLH